MSTSTHSQSQKKLILVIGATGAQGQAVIDALLAPDAEERPSSYAIRALTRDPTNAFSQELAKRGVEVVKGSFMDFDSVARALEGAYGVWVNTDGFTVGEAAEIVGELPLILSQRRTEFLDYRSTRGCAYTRSRSAYRRCGTMCGVTCHMSSRYDQSFSIIGRRGSHVRAERGL
jgi:hypothetical protein